MIDAVASDYQEDITFLAIAGSSTPEKSANRVGVWFDPSRVLWAYDDDLWAEYLVRYQPVSVLISGDDVIIERFFGRVDEPEMRAALDRLREIG